MNLIQVDVIRTQTFQRCVHGLHDVISRQTAVIRSRSHRTIYLGANHHLVAPAEIVESAAENFFAGTIGIDIRSVEKIDAAFQGRFDDAAAEALVDRPSLPLVSSEGHCAQTNFRNFETGPPKLYVSD